MLILICDQDMRIIHHFSNTSIFSYLNSPYSTRQQGPEWAAWKKTHGTVTHPKGQVSLVKVAQAIDISVLPKRWSPGSMGTELRRSASASNFWPFCRLFILWANKRLWAGLGKVKPFHPWVDIP